MPQGPPTKPQGSLAKPQGLKPSLRGPQPGLRRAFNQASKGPQDYPDKPQGLQAKPQETPEKPWLPTVSSLMIIARASVPLVRQKLDNTDIAPFGAAALLT